MAESNILRISILKTLQFNLHYFGLRGLKFPVLIFKNFRLNKLCGKVELRDWSFGSVRLGQQMVGIIDDKTEKGIWSVGGGTVCFNGKVKIGSACRICCNEKGNIIFEDGVNINRSDSCCKRQQDNNRKRFFDIVGLPFNGHRFS